MAEEEKEEENVLNRSNIWLFIIVGVERTNTIQCRHNRQEQLQKKDKSWFLSFQ